MSKLRILYVGPDYPGSNGTCWRDAFQQLGHEVLSIDDERYNPAPRGLVAIVRHRLRRRPPISRIRALNERIVREARAFRPELTFYIKAYYVLPETLEETRRIGLNFSYVNDDMFHPGVRTFTFFDNVKRMDCILTTKSFSVREYHAAGAPLAIYIPNAYDPRIHYPAQPTPEERRRYQADVAFIGNFGRSKADLLARLAVCKDEFHINVWGPDWHKMTRIDQWHRCRRWLRLRDCLRGQGLWCAEMGKAIQSTRIILGLLLRDVRDLHTSRSFEIPACAGFLLADRTEEHRLYFEEDKEAVYFSTLQELVDKIRFYLAHEHLRTKIAQAGYEKCLRLKARYVDRAAFAVEQYEKLTGTSFPVGENLAARGVESVAN